MEAISCVNIFIQQPKQVLIFPLQSPHPSTIFTRNVVSRNVFKFEMQSLPILRSSRTPCSRSLSQQVFTHEGLLTVEEEEEKNEDRRDIGDDSSLGFEEKPSQQKQREVKEKRLRWTDVDKKLDKAQKKLIEELPPKMSGRTKALMKHIVCLSEDDDPSELLFKWVRIMKPRRGDWLSLLKEMNKQKHHLFFKVTEIAFSEESFEANIRDYTKLIDAYAREGCLEDAERILQEMEDKGFTRDGITFTVLIQMYSKASNLERAKEIFNEMRLFGIKLDQKAYGSMVMAYVRAGMPEVGESLIREMESKDINAGKEVYKALLKAFAHQGHAHGAQRVFDAMQFAGIMPNLNSCTVLVDAYGRAGDPDEARNVFENMMKVGHMPDDKCTSIMIAAYEKKNLLDKALTLLMNLEKDGFKPGVETLAILIDWFGKLGLVEEAEQIFEEIAKMEEVPSRVHVSLCDMYSRAGLQEKAVNILNNMHDNFKTLSVDAFERLIHGLLVGGLVDEANKMHEQMHIQGLAPSEPITLALVKE